MDQRERFSDDEEALRAAVAGVLKHHHFAAVSILAQDSDGKTLVAQPAMKRRDVAQDGTTQFVDHPVLLDVPIHHPGGGGVTHTFAQKAGDEIVSIILSRPSSPWKQNGGVQQPVETRMNSLSDAVALPGFRSDPRQLQQISTTSAQVRDDAKMHVADHDPAAGITHFSADPSTPPASTSFDPFTMASAFYRHVVQGAVGILGSAVSSGGTHQHGVTHAGGAFMRAMNGLHQVLAQPSGALLSAFNGAHTVTANASGVQIASSAAIALQCPPGGLGLPSGGVGSGALASGAASTNVGTLSGDLGGTLPAPQVIGLTHVDASTLPIATSDAAAAAAGVPLHGLYRDTSIASGKTVIVMRAA